MDEETLDQSPDTPEEQPAQEGVQEAPDHEENDGTGGEAVEPHQEGGTGDDSAETQTSNESKRVNDLMSKWQTTQAENERLKQELAEKSGQPHQQSSKEDDSTPYFMKPDWSFKSQDDVKKALVDAMSLAEQNAVKRLEQQQLTQAQSHQQAVEQVNNFYEYCSENDTEFNKDAFEAYVKKVDFPLRTADDLPFAYRAYVENRNAVKKAQEVGETNARKKDTNVSSGNSPLSDRPGVSYSSIRNKSFHELAHED